MATGLQSVAEAAMHSMKEIFDDELTDAVILVDASNTFNSLNRNAALHNIQILCPQFSAILMNIYRLSVRMIVFGSKDIVPNEGATQGDNLVSLCSWYSYTIELFVNIFSEYKKCV